MSTSEVIDVDSSELLSAWQQTLPQTLNESDSVVIRLDGSNSQDLLIHIGTDGRSGYTFDFQCNYQDDREVKVLLIDVEKDGVHIDEHTETVQNLIEDYVRHIHECAQILHPLTKES